MRVTLLTLLALLFQAQASITPESIAARSFVARNELNARHYTQALGIATEVENLVKANLGAQRLDTEPYLPLALGAAYEVQAQALAATGRRSEALALLAKAENDWRGTSIIARLQKNVLLLTLVGHPLPALEGVPAPAWRGKPVLLFFWAHWCADCKAEAPVLSRLASEYSPKGLAISVPTQLYGYIGSQTYASPADEEAFIERVYQHFYSSIPVVARPENSVNFDRFGVSTTPTIVLADRRGIVTLYHPGFLDEASLRQAIERAFR